MSDRPRRRLREIIQNYGLAICDDPSRCKGLLLDFCGEYRGEINVLVTALLEGFVQDLLSFNGPYELLRARLARRLCTDWCMTEEAALWGVDSWVLALGRVSEQELQNLEDYINIKKAKREANELQNAWKPWDKAEVDALLWAFDESIKDLAENFQCTTDDLMLRLYQRGRIAFQPGGPSVDPHALNTGKQWTEAEDDELLWAFDEALENLADEHQRSRKAIESQLRQHRRMAYQPGNLPTDTPALNARKSWDRAEDGELIEAFDEAIRGLAEEHQRTVLAIISRLFLHGKKAYQSGSPRTDPLGALGFVHSRD